MQMQRNDGVVVTMNGVMAYFPRLTGHGEDDYYGNYQLHAYDG